MPIGGGSPSPLATQRAIIFVDGTNLFHRLAAAKLTIPQLFHLLAQYVAPRQLHRIYLYTVKQQFDKARATHGEKFCDGIRVVLGEGVLTQDGNIKEKGVDALLVGDLVYHAAMKNCNYALVVSTDTDFAHAIKRVEDFGCRTGVVAICTDVPERLRSSCDDAITVEADWLLRTQIAKPL